MRKVGQILLAGTVVSALVSPVAIGLAKAEPEVKLAQANAPPLTEEQKKRQQQQQQQQRPPAPPPQRQAPPPPPPPQAAPPQPPRQPQAPAQTQPPPRVPPQAPAQTQPPPRVPPQAPAQTQPPPRVPPQAPAQTQPPPHVPPQAPAQVLPPPQQPPTNAPAQNQPPRRQPPPQAPAQTQPPPQQPPTAPAQVQPPPRQPQTAPTQAAPVAPVRPQQPPTANVAPPPPLPAPTPQQARPLPAASSGPAAIVLTSPQGQPVRRVDQLRSERREVVEGNRTIIREPDRVIVREANGVAFIRHSDVDRFRYGARDVRVETRGRDNVTTVVLPNGQRVVTVLDADGRLLRRSRWVDGREIVIIDQRPVAPGFNYFVELPPPIVRIPRERYIVDLEAAPPALIYDTLMAPPVEQIDQPYTLDQVRYSYSLRERMPSIDIDTINFETGSWEVSPDQVDRLAGIADGINRAIQANPKEVFMIEGHTDAVGNDVDNLSLSDRRAETVALILSQQFSVPPENLVTQGYGRQYLKIPTDGPERRNRRVTVRRITPLLEQQAGGPPPGPPPR